MEKWTLALAIIAGASLSPGILTEDTRSLLVTFNGLVAASILPTISLLINTMAPDGRSVHAINNLERELRAAMDALFLLLGSTMMVVGALAALATPAPAIFDHVPYLASEILPRGGQSLAIAFSVLILVRAGQIPGILRRTLSYRHEIAVDKARRATLENAPTPAGTRESFKTHPDFGKKVTLEDLQGNQH